MFRGGQLIEVGNLLAAGYGLYQAKRHHEVEQEKAEVRHRHAVELAKKQHENDMKLVKQTYLLDLFNSLEQHFQQLNADLISSSRESERDMFDQRNQSFQTIILASTVMFSALSNVIVQGTIPSDSGDFLLIAYSLTSSLSFFFLFICVVLCIELVIRISTFMYRRGKVHSNSLQSAINDTKIMMKALRGESSSFDPVRADSLQSSRFHNDRLSVSSLNSENNGSSRSGTSRRNIIKMGSNEINDEFEKHEPEIRRYLSQRQKINQVEQHEFKRFWDESCEFWWMLAIWFFYGGSLNLLLALMVFMWAEFVIYYNCILGAIIGVVLLGFILIVGVLIVFIMRRRDAELNRSAPDSNTDRSSSLLYNDSDTILSPADTNDIHADKAKDEVEVGFATLSDPLSRQILSNQPVSSSEQRLDISLSVVEQFRDVEQGTAENRSSYSTVSSFSASAFRKKYSPSEARDRPPRRRLLTLSGLNPLRLSPFGTPAQTPTNEKKTHRPFDFQEMGSIEEQKVDELPSPPGLVITPSNDDGIYYP